MVSTSACPAGHQPGQQASSIGRPTPARDARSVEMAARAATVEAEEEAEPGLDVETREDEWLDEDGGAGTAAVRHSQPLPRPTRRHQQRSISGLLHHPTVPRVHWTHIARCVLGCGAARSAPR